jgi:hypothetical protein
MNMERLQREKEVRLENSSYRNMEGCKERRRRSD